jgi:hypothetical protein
MARISKRNIQRPEGKFHFPFDIQKFLDSIAYSSADRYRCPENVWRDRKAHCYDGAVFAAAALKKLGYPPLLAELLPNDRDDDHIIAVFHEGDRWGAIAKSNFTGLRYREPVYRDLRELIMSYFELYFNIKGEKTLKGYTSILNLSRFDHLNWESNDSAMETIANALDRLKRHRIISPAAARKLSQVDGRSYKAGLLGSKFSGLFKP